jgi:hypothetical protein
MEGARHDATVAIFDYECDTSRFDDTATRQTVFAVRSTRLTTSHFALIPARWRDRWLDKSRRNAVIGSGYRLYSDDAARFSPIDERILQILDGHSCLEAGGGCMLLYRRGSLIAPRDVDRFFTTGLRVYALLLGAKQPDTA